MNSFPMGGLRTLPVVERVVHKRSFLKSVQWAFTLSVSQDVFVKSFGDSIQKKGFDVDTDFPENEIVSGKKGLVSILASNSILLITCPGNAYENFEVFLPKMVEILEAAEQSGMNQIAATICLKTDGFEIDKEKLDAPFDALEINKMLFSEAFLNEEENSLFTMQDNVIAHIQKKEKDSVSKYVVELMPGVISTQKYNISESLSFIKEINTFSYYAWAYAMNPFMVQSLDE